MCMCTVTQAHECAHALVLGQAGSGPPVWGLRGDVYVTLVTSQCESLQAPDGWHPGRHGPPSSALKAGVWGSPQSDFLPCVSPCAAWDMVTWHHLWFLSAGPSAGGSCLPSFFSALREQSPPCSRCLQSPLPGGQCWGPQARASLRCHSQTHSADTGPRCWGGGVGGGLQRVLGFRPCTAHTCSPDARACLLGPQACPLHPSVWDVVLSPSS